MLRELYSRHVCQEITIYQKKESIGDSVFIYRHEVVDGEVSEVWLINEAVVSFRDYEKSLEEAECLERRRVRQTEHDKREQHDREKSAVVREGYKKIIACTVNEIAERLQRINTYQLQPYLAFSQASYTSYPEFAALSQELLPSAQKMLKASDGVHSIHEYEQMLATIDSVPEKLDTLFYDTTHNAIQCCNDTKVLKELLEVVAKT